MHISLTVFWAFAAAFVLLILIFIREKIKAERWKKKMEERVSGTVVPYWRSIQTAAIPKLTHPHEAAERADELLQILKRDPVHRMSDEDRAELDRRMEAVAAGKDPMITGKDERDLARVFPVIMRQVELEDANNNPIDEVQLVGSKGSVKQ
jgi:hypothetical protein